ncbi:MAG TPA: aspartate/glutamate racemase family protein [Gammaproteobacteria bacterium]|nr:aspartate/glutamate racemase family protein [Gammaproteobacteria bacterium]
MKTLGLIGGMSWESTAHYYTRLNQLVGERLGGLHSARLLLYSVEFDEIQRLQHADDWDAAGRILADAARRLERAGAEAILICANTMHRVAPAIAAAIHIPILSVIDATAQAVKKQHAETVALLGTRFTMEMPFYRDALERHGLKVLTPDAGSRADIHRIIFSELCKGEVKPESAQRFFEIVAGLADQGAEAAILGCTEFTLFDTSRYAGIPLFDTTEIHARAAVAWAIRNDAGK